MSKETLDSHLLELLRAAIPAASPAVTATEGLSAETIRAGIAKMRAYQVPTWVVPPGTHVDPLVPVNVVHSPLVGPDHFVVIPVDAFDPHPFDA